ncbi:hypothetical protein MAMC_00994 [Methylacidimicrobium cyclopophantes]|uniref:Uncharacterized protein n=1 Tax=Methylacidimicrobium cyclopophantes TaxID=1041766 RepID=A0A5E6MAH1_9BACT|nr:hypothetical protein [Methylacidimicrobium cyclopophantes]VVM06218.1 hypothetical protein MAMC_00994 [Methylacidimicrobium cyclopophantes]
MHEVNGFAILNDGEVALVLGNNSGGGKVIRIASPSLSRSGMEALSRTSNSLRQQARELASEPELRELLAEGLSKAQEAQEARSDSAACQATAYALRDRDWQYNREVLAQLATVTDRMGSPCAPTLDLESERKVEGAIPGERIPSFEEFITSAHRNLSRAERIVLANLYEELAGAYRSRCNAFLRYGAASSDAETALRRTNPWLAKGYYRPMKDSRERILADAQGRIFFEYVNPATPTRWARNCARASALACGTTGEEADRFAERFRFCDILSGEICAGARNAASHFAQVLASKKVTDPYARAFAIVFWSVKDFLDSRSGEYPEVTQGSALREAVGKAACLLELPQVRSSVEEELKKAERWKRAQERQIEQLLSKNGWRSSREERATTVDRFRSGCDRGR